MQMQPMLMLMLPQLQLLLQFALVSQSNNVTILKLQFQEQWLRRSAKKSLISRLLKTVPKPSQQNVHRLKLLSNIHLLLLGMIPRLDHLLLLVTLLLLSQSLLDMPVLDTVLLDMEDGNYHQDNSRFRQPTCFESSKYYRYNFSPQSNLINIHAGQK